MFGLNSMVWLALLVWVGVPLFALGMGWLLWRRSRTPLGKNFVVVASIAVLFTPLLVSNGVKYYYDAQVREMCAKDGGVRVYETVRLPKDKFNEYGQINFYKPTQGENALGEEYLLKTDIQYLRSGNPSLRRYHVRVVRHREGFLLGESVGYDRGGGDLPGPWQPSSYSCPKNHGEAVIDNIFIVDQGV